jgi:hypothetical protein
MLDDYSLTEDEKSAGVGSLLEGTYARSYYRLSGGHSSGAASYPANHGKKWTAQELSLVSKQFRGGKSIDYTANNMERTCYSIAWQLYEMNLITEKQREAIKGGLKVIEDRHRLGNGQHLYHKTEIPVSTRSLGSRSVIDVDKDPDPDQTGNFFLGIIQAIGFICLMFFMAWLASL